MPELHRRFGKDRESSLVGAFLCAGIDKFLSVIIIIVVIHHPMNS